MKKYIMISLFFLGSFQVSGTDSYEIDTISDTLIGKLWKGQEVSEEDVKTLFSTVAELTSAHRVHAQESHAKKEEIIKEWENEMLDYLKACHVNDPKKIGAIKDFSNKANQESHFSDRVINDSLRLILNAY